MENIDIFENQTKGVQEKEGEKIIGSEIYK